MVHHARIEQVDAGRYGRVGGEDVAGAGGFQGLFEAELLVAHEEADLFQRQKRGVAFVHVEHRGFEPHGLQRAHAADAQHDFLADARIDIAAVEGIGDVAVLRQHVFGNVGVQQVERDAAHVQLPDLNEHVAGGQLDRDLQILAVGILHRAQAAGYKNR